MEKLSYQEAKEYLAKFKFKNRNEYYLFRKNSSLFDPSLKSFPDFLHINPKSYYMQSEGINFTWPDYLNTNTTKKNTKNLSLLVVKELFEKYKINSINQYKKISSELKTFKGIDLPVNLNDHFNQKNIKFSYKDHFYKNNLSNVYSEFEIENVLIKIKEKHELSCLGDFNKYCKTEYFHIHDNKLPIDLYKAYPNIFYSKIINIINPNILKQFNQKDSIDNYNPYCNKKVSWKCNICDYTWDAIFNYRLRLNVDCPECGKIKCALNRKKNIALNNRGFLSEHPYLKKEIDSDSLHNSMLNFDEITSHSDIYIDWLCHCKRKWTTQVKNRCRGTGCPDCSLPKRIKSNRQNNIAKNGSFLQKCPNEAKYWDYEKNLDLPENWPAGSDVKKYFYCKECNYSWQANLNSVAKKLSRCKCFSKIFEQQTRLYAEFISLGLLTHFEHRFPNSEIAGTESDIFLPEINICIECDGYPWHSTENKIKFDINKNQKFQSQGYSVIRFRDVRLKSISDYEVYYNQKNMSLLNPVMELIEMIISMIEDGYIKNKLIQYKNNNKFVGDNEFHKIFNERKIPNSLANLKPDLAKEYSSANPIKAESICLGHKHPVKWQCSFCGHLYERLIRNRLRTTDKGCPKCSNTANYVSETNNLLFLFPIIVNTFWDFDKNKKHPSEYRPNSTKKVWIKCQFGCSPQIQAGALTRKKCKSFECPICKQLNNKPEEN